MQKLEYVTRRFYEREQIAEIEGQSKPIQMNQHLNILDYLALYPPEKPGDGYQWCQAPEFRGGRVKYRERRLSKRELRAMRLLAHRERRLSKREMRLRLLD